MRLPCLSPFMVWPPLLVRRAPCHAVGLLHHGQASSGGGVAPGRRVCPGAQRVDAAAYVGCALGMNGPAGAIVAGCGVTASSGARRSVARSRRSPGARPCTRSPTILGCACADRCSRGSWSQWRAYSVGATRPHAPRRSLRSAVGRAVFYFGLCAAPLGSDFLHAPCRLLRRFSSSWEARNVIPPGLRQGLGASALPIARNGSPP